MFKEQNVNAIIGILWGLAVYFNLSNLDPMSLNVFAIWAVSINRFYRHFSKGKKKKEVSVNKATFEWLYFLFAIHA